MRRHLILILLLLGTTALIGCNKAAEEEKPTPVAAIKTITVGLANASERVTLYGGAEPRAGGEAAVAVPVEASVDRIVASNGARVAAGAVIATLRPSATSQLDLAKARNDAATLAAAYTRAQRLRSNGLMSDADVETARGAAHTAALTQASLATRSGHLVLRAPIAGNVQAITVHSGDLLPAGTTLARVVAAGKLRARFGIDPALARRVTPGMPIDVSLANGDALVTTRVTSVDKVVDPITRQAALIAQLPDGHGASPGEALRASVNIGSGITQPVVPYAALLDDGGQSYVFVIEKGAAHRRNVTAAAAQRDTVSISAGLKPGEHVAISGGTALEDGMKVSERGVSTGGAR